jgi:zinc finger BED domain-containing protein 5/7/8/9
VKLTPLSADTIAREDMSDDIDRQLAEDFSNNQEPISKLWALQIDESTDISNKAQLLAYIRIVMNGSIQKQFLFCSELKKTTTGQDIFKLVKKKIDSRGIKWKNCVTVCTDGAPSMLGCKKGFVAYVLKVNRNVKIVHCMHDSSRALPGKLCQTMNEVIKVANYFKSNSFRT